MTSSDLVGRQRREKKRLWGKWRPKWVANWLSSLSVPDLARLSIIFHRLSCSPTPPATSPAPIRLIVSCDLIFCELFLTRLAPTGLADFLRINQSHSSIYGDVGIAIGAPYKVRVRRATLSATSVESSLLSPHLQLSSGCSSQSRTRSPQKSPRSLLRRTRALPGLRRISCLMRQLAAY